MANPIEWMLHSGSGVCVLDWGDDAMGMLRQIHGPGRQLVVRTARFGQALRQGMAKRHNLPPVAVAA